MSCQSQFALLSLYKRQVLREEECESAKTREAEKQREREVVGDKGGFQRGRAHFETGVWDLTEVRFAFHGGRPHSIWTFQKCFSVGPPIAHHLLFAVNTLICLSPANALEQWNIFILYVVFHLLQTSAGGTTESNNELLMWMKMHQGLN